MKKVQTTLTLISSFLLAGSAIPFAMKDTASEQLLVSKTSETKADLLIWLYLGQRAKDGSHANVAVLNGSGVCNGLSLDMINLVKRLKSQNN